jgi:hypothetical protein
MVGEPAGALSAGSAAMPTMAPTAPSCSGGVGSRGWYRQTAGHGDDLCASGMAEDHAILEPTCQATLI